MRGLPQPVSQCVVLSSVLPMLAPMPMARAADHASRSAMGAADAPCHNNRPAAAASQAWRARGVLTSSRLEGAVFRSMSYLICTLITGLVATAVMDIWGVVRKPLLGLPAADYRLVGRWVSYFAQWMFRHASIPKAPSMPGEATLGWIAHYLLGLAFAAAFLVLAGTDWLAHPR